MDLFRPRVGACCRVVVLNVLAELHAEPPKDVRAVVAVGDGACAPPTILGRDLDDGSVAGCGSTASTCVRFSGNRR